MINQSQTPASFPHPRTLISVIEKSRAGSDRANVYSRREKENIIQGDPEDLAISEVTTRGFRKAGGAGVLLRWEMCPCPVVGTHRP
jgi:hypothetical protein